MQIQIKLHDFLKNAVDQRTEHYLNNLAQMAVGLQRINKISLGLEAQVNRLSQMNVPSKIAKAASEQGVMHTSEVNSKLIKENELKLSRFEKVGNTGETINLSSDNWCAVLDRDNSLMWSVNSSVYDSDSHPNYLATLDYVKHRCNRINKEKYCGFSDWRISTFHELKTLLTEKKSIFYYIDEKFFPDLFGYGAYWTSSPEPLQNKSSVHVIDFWNHTDFFLLSSKSACVRFVRSASIKS